MKAILAVVSTVFIVAASAQAATLVVYGASAPIGSLIVQEALSRGHTVIGVSRTKDKLTVKHPQFEAAVGDLTDAQSFRTLSARADALVISVSGNGKDNLPENSAHALAARIAVAEFTGQPRAPYVLQVGGATTVWETREKMQANLPMPAPAGSAMHGMLFGHLVALETYRASNIRWTVLTPPNNIEGWSPGAAPTTARTGKYRTATIGLVRDAQGQSRLNIADLAVAAVDEIEQQRFVGKRFTAGY